MSYTTWWDTIGDGGGVTRRRQVLAVFPSVDTLVKW